MRWLARGNSGRGVVRTCCKLLVSVPTVIPTAKAVYCARLVLCKGKITYMFTLSLRGDLGQMFSNSKHKMEISKQMSCVVSTQNKDPQKSHSPFLSKNVDISRLLPLMLIWEIWSKCLAYQFHSRHFTPNFLHSVASTSAHWILHSVHSYLVTSVIRMIF